MKNKIYYFVFGIHAVELLNNEGFDVLKEGIRAGRVTHELLKYDPQELNPVKLLRIANGWQDFAEITEAQFNELKM